MKITIKNEEMFQDWTLKERCWKSPRMLNKKKKNYTLTIIIWFKISTWARMVMDLLDHPAANTKTFWILGGHST